MGAKNSRTARRPSLPSLLFAGGVWPFPSRFKQSDGRGRPSHLVARASPPALRNLASEELTTAVPYAAGALLATPGCPIQDNLVSIGDKPRALQATPLQTRP